MILDIGLPDISGLEVARRLRAAGSDMPILMLTARDTVGDRVTGLDAGADDYLVKPFAFEELSARLRALARRGHGARPPHDARSSRPGPIALDETARRVTVDGATVDLSPREFSLLECLLRHPGQTLSRDQLLDQAWPFGVAVTPNAVDAYVHYLRDKLGTRRPQHRDGPRRRLPPRRCLTGSPRRRATPMTPTEAGLLRRVRLQLALWSGGITLACWSCSGSSSTSRSTARCPAPARPSWSARPTD